jgi:gliding motility-associated-like protein
MKKCFLLSLILAYFFNTSFSQTTVTFNYTGAVQTWIVPPCVYTINVVAAGAKGGGNIGGNGARITANIAVTPGQVLNIYVGGMGSCGNNSGGWNGGGTGYASNPANAAYNSCGGGGATDLRIGGTALVNRVIVAGGGGGKGGGSSPVCGGSANCNVGAAGCNTYGAGGGGGTLAGGGGGGAPWAGTPPGGSAGTLGNGGQGGYWSTASGGGGGGGYYGGGGGGNDGCCTGANGGGGGGGGSSLVPAGGSCLAANNANNGYLTITYSGGAAQITATNNGPICTGGTLQLSTAAQGTYAWSGPNGFTSNLQNPSIPNVTTAAAGTYTLTVNLGGCIGTTTTTVVVNQSPTVTATGATICSGQPGTVTATVSPAMAGTYTWNTGATGTTLTASPNATTNYTVTFTPTGGCPGTASAAITVNPTPVLTVSNATICDGQSATLTASSTIAGGTFTWNPGGINGSTLNVSPITTITYTVSYSSPAGCVAANINGTVIVNPTPSVTVNNLTICNGQTATLTATPTVPGGTYTWSNGSSTQSINVNPATTTTYTVNYSTGAGCAAPVASGTVTVNPTPTITATSATICAGQSAILNASTNTQGGTFTWNPGGIIGSTLNVSPQNTTTYTLSYVSGAGCVSNNATGTITVNPVASVTVNSDTICDGNSTTLIATPSIPGGTFLWNNGATTQSITVSPNTTTTYTVDYTSAAGCSSAQAIGIVTVNPSPVLTVNNATICSGQTANLTAVSSLPLGVFTWNPGGMTSSSVQVSPVQTTSYTVTFNSNLNCPSAPATAIVTVNPTPTVTIIDDTICNGSAGTLNTTVSVPGGTYLWNPGGSTAQNLTVSPNTTTSYSLVYSTGANCSSAAVTGIITVNPIPTLITTLASPTLCSGDAVSIGLNSNTPGSVISWTTVESQVTGATSGSGTNINDVINSINTNTGNVTYTIISQANNCNSLPQNVMVTVYPIPNITLLNDTICQGEQATLNAIPDVQGGTFIWSYNALATQSITLSPNQSTSYNVLYDYNGCVNTASASIVVNVIPSVTLNSGNICFGDSLLLTANPSIPGGTFNWNPGGIGPQSIMATPNSTTSISVDYTLNNCTSQLATSNITVTQLPVIVMDDTTICQGQAATMTAIPNQPGGIFSWSPGGPGPQTAVFTPASTTAISVTYTLNGCSSDSVMRNVFVNPLPVANVISPSVSGCLPLTYVFHADTTVAHDYFTWNLNGNSFTGDSINGTVAGPGCQNITLTNTLNGCSTSNTYLDYLCPEAAPIASFDASIGYFTEPNQSVSFINSSAGAVTYNWLFGDGGFSTTESPQHNFSGIGSGGTTVWLYAYSNLGCVDSTSKDIPFQDGLIYYIPNTFTPDGDIYNNTFKPIFTSGFDPFNYSLQIYDRWGELIFESLNPTFGWDGTYGLNGNLIQIGTYSYRVRFKVLKNDEYKIVVGHVNLLK